MQIEFNPNIQQNSKATPTFGAIDYSAAKNVLKNALNSEELIKFRQMIHNNKNDKVDVVLFGEGKKKLSANVADKITDSHLENYQCKPYSQRLFESPLKFIERMCKKADKRAEEIEEIAKRNKIIDELE